MLSGEAGAVYADSVSRCVVDVGDMDGDGWEDLMIGYPLLSSVFVYQGTSTGFKNLKVSYVISGESKSDYLGWAVARAGDVNRDGQEDVWISALYKGTVYLLCGRSSAGDFNIASLPSNAKSYKVIGNVGSVRSFIAVGIAVAMAGDVNGDGYFDMALTALTSSSQSIVYVIYGSSSLSNVLLSDISSNSGKGFKIVPPSLSVTGFSLSGSCDINGDGLSDLIIGSLPYSAVGSSYGVQKTYVVYGNRTMTSSVDLSQLEVCQGFTVVGAGFMVAGVSDVNGDGYDDAMVVSYQGWVTQGNAYLLTFPQNMTSAPTLLPSSRPSTQPSSEPTTQPSNSLPTSSPSELLIPTSSSNQSNVPLNPTIVPSRRPSRCPTTYKPSMIPTKAPTVLPTLTPSSSSIPTLFPTFKTSITPTRRPTIHPSVHPSYQPTSFPSYPTLTAILITLVNQTSGGEIGAVHGTPGREEIFSIQSLNTSSLGKSLTIVGGRGRKIYEIFPLSNTEVILADFQPVQKNDVIDFSRFSTITKMSDISYSTFPVVLLLPNNQLVELSSYKVFNFTSKAFLFAPDTTSSSTSSSTSVSAASILAVVMSLSVSDVIVIGVLVTVTLVVFFSSCIQRDHKKVQGLSSKRRYVVQGSQGTIGSPHLESCEVERVKEVLEIGKSNRARDEVVDDNEEENQAIAEPQIVSQQDQRLTTQRSSHSSSLSSDEEASSDSSETFDELSS